VSGFDLLHPLVQHHIVNSLGWPSLRPFQEDAIAPLIARQHALLLAPTAGGKTEAAMFPMFSRMLAEDWKGLSVLYVCPLRALLNNLHPRLEHYGRLFGRRVELWHGDIGDSSRRRIVTDPPDVLLTTPESLEVMLITRREHHDRLFSDLRAAVVDEIHAFAGDDRGWHLLSVLERLEFRAGHPLQRVGLSATVGNPHALLDWLAGSASGTRVVLAPKTEAAGDVELTIDAVGTLSNAATVISRLHTGEKRLVFCDSRSKVEDLAAQLRALEVQTFVSHSSLSLDERRRAEEAFASGHDCVIVATSTLELGVDVGDLDRVIQIDAPVAVASFLQRLGRTGRRAGTTRNYLFLTTTPESLMQAAALVRLWGSGHVEHVRPPAAPFHILAQQIMALALQYGGIGHDDWRNELNGVSAFREMDERDLALMVAHMLTTGILREEQGILWLGETGEAEYGYRHFMELFTAFISEPLVAVRHGDRHVGNVHQTTFARWPDADVVLVLAGHSWRVTNVDWKQRIAQVAPSGDEGRSRWAGSGQPIRYELCQAMRDVLLGATMPATLSQRAVRALDELRQDFEWLDASATAIVRRKDAIRWWTFGGLYANTAIASRLKAERGYAVAPNNLAIKIAGEPSDSAIANSIQAVRALDAETLVPEVTTKALEGLKFSACLPPELARRVLQRRMADSAAVRQVLAAPAQLVAVR
jgi:ATP-dependent helicase Lhr and Lhr-like helicase